MDPKAQAAHHESKNNDQPCVEDSGQESEEEHVEQESADEEITTGGEEKEPTRGSQDSKNVRSSGGLRNVFMNGLYIGLGIGFIATFVTMWVAVFFSPQLPSGATYQTLLPIFIYPLIYLLAVGLIVLTAGLVREYYVPKINS